MKSMKFLIFLLLLPLCGIAEILNVPGDFETIQGAVDETGNGDTVLVDPGNYVENVVFPERDIVLASLFLTTGDSAYIDSTVIDGGLNGSVITFGETAGSESQLIGFTIQNGNGTEFEERVCGGGIFITDSRPTIRYCKIIDCSAWYGGGVFAFSLFDSPQQGPYLENCTIVENAAEYGGGVYLDARISCLTGCTVNGNIAREEGGGVYFKFDSEVLFSNCTFTSNQADVAGGGICGRNSIAEFSRVDMGENATAFQAGALYLSACSSTMRFSLIRANRAVERCGGVVLDERSTMDVVNCTFTENWAGAVRCGIHIRNSSSSTIVNSIFWRNMPAQLCFGDGDNNVFTVAYSDIEEGRDGIIGNGEVNWCQRNIDSDPLFTNADELDYSLAENSPCIDAGTAAFFWDNVDVVHLDRDEYSGDSPDIGCFESDFNDIQTKNISTPREFQLYSSFPNPFNSTTTISYSLPVASQVSLRIFDLSGREVKSLVEGYVKAGSHAVSMSGEDMASGVYLARMEAGEKTFSMKLMLLR